MNIREEQEKREHLIFSPYASFSDESRGRDRDEEPCPMRTIYQRDRDRIIHCKAFRRLKHKTQVFLTRGRPLQNKTDSYLRGCPDCKKYSKGA